jgi:hypothetical protein
VKDIVEHWVRARNRERPGRVSDKAVAEPPGAELFGVSGGIRVAGGVEGGDGQLGPCREGAVVVDVEW